MELFTYNKGWVQARVEVRFTLTAGMASKKHVAAVAPLVPVLARWTTLEAERSATDDAVDDAHAVVAWTDETLGEAIEKVALTLLVSCNNDRTHPTFAAFFPERPSEIAKLTLEPKVERVRRWRSLRQEVKVNDAVSEALDGVEAAAAEGDAAIESRKGALDAQARVSLRLKAWRDAANVVRRSVELALDQYAVTQGLAKGYSAKFFPKSPTKKKAKAEDAKKADAKKTDARVGATKTDVMTAKSVPPPAPPARPSVAPPTH